MVQIRLQSSIQKKRATLFRLMEGGPRGERALSDLIFGWLAHRNVIRVGVDDIRVKPIAATLILGDVMSRFFSHKLSKVRSKELSPATSGIDFRSQPRD